MKIQQIKEKGYYALGVIKTIKQGGRIIPVDPDGKVEIWKCDGDYYWLENGVSVKLGSKKR